MSEIGLVGYYFEDDSLETSVFLSILVTEPEHPYMEGWRPPIRTIGYERTFVDAVEDLLDGIAVGEGPAPTSEDGHRCRAVSKFVERGVGSRQWTRPEAYEQRAEREK